jgi:hypothetical protein
VDPNLRRVAFGALSLQEVARTGATGEPWSSFAEAERLLTGGARQQAEDVLRRVVATQGLESRSYLQAWRFLRDLGVQPDKSIAATVFGVIVEVHLPNKGRDVLAAYADHRARFFGHGGGAIFWENPDASLDGDIDALLAAANDLSRIIGVWEGPTPDEVATGIARISLLTPSGLRFGQGTITSLSKDPKGGRTFAMSALLLKALVEKSVKKGTA